MRPCYACEHRRISIRQDPDPGPVSEDCESEFAYFPLFYIFIFLLDPSRKCRNTNPARRRQHRAVGVLSRVRSGSTAHVQTLSVSGAGASVVASCRDWQMNVCVCVCVCVLFLFCVYVLFLIISVFFYI